MPRGQLIIRTCYACAKVFETTRPKATRCPTCITEGRQVRYKRCFTCNQNFPALTVEEKHCVSCAEAQGISQSDLTAEHLEIATAEKKSDKWESKVAGLEDALEERANEKPKGTRKMSKKTKDSAVGIAWLELVSRDGQVSSLSQLHGSDIDEDTKLRLVMAFTRLRLKGYSLDALSQLCPVHLMSLDEDKAISGLPLVENPNPPTPQEMAEIELGLA